MKLKNEYKNLQRQAMKNLKQQLQEKSSNDSNRLEQRKHKQPEKTDSENAGKETYEKKSDKGLIELSYTPGVVLKFQCQRHGTKKELRVRQIQIFSVIGWSTYIMYNKSFSPTIKWLQDS